MLTILKMLSRLKNLWPELIGHVVPTLLLVGLITGVVGYAHNLRLERDLAMVENKTLQKDVDRMTTNANNDQIIIQQLNDLRAIDSQTMMAIHEENKSLYSAAIDRQTKITQLEKTNAKVKVYLNEPVPADLRMLIDSQTAKYRVRDEIDANQSASLVID